MLADGVEATVRAKRPSSMEELSKIVTDSIQTRANAGQLDECPLTFSELYLIKQAFIDVLRGIHHPRITYPPEPGAVVVTEQPGQAPDQALGQEPVSEPMEEPNGRTGLTPGTLVYAAGTDDQRPGG